MQYVAFSSTSCAQFLQNINVLLAFSFIIQIIMIVVKYFQFLLLEGNIKKQEQIVLAFLFYAISL